MSEQAKSKRPLPKDTANNLDIQPATAIERFQPIPEIKSSDMMTLYTAVIYLLCGRGRVGKTFISNLLIKRLRMADRSVVMVDADNHNDGLRKYYGAEAHTYKDNESTPDFIRRMIDLVTKQGGAAVWDAGGNDQAFNDFAGGMKFVRYLKQYNIAVVMLYVLGDDISDLSNISTHDKRKSFEADKIILCANAGAPRTTRAKDPFEDLVKSPVIEDLVQRGADLIEIPAFAFKDELNRKDLDITDAVAGKPGQDGIPLGPTTIFEIKCWWEDVETAFKGVEEWLR